ncbi:hypothetical protein EON67_06445 [archaeon]|nr:MAG: hypothetical protein EON67_06445 [archaeon]
MRVPVPVGLQLMLDSLQGTVDEAVREFQELRRLYEIKYRQRFVSRQPAFPNVRSAAQRSTHRGTRLALPARARVRTRTPVVPTLLVRAWPQGAAGSCICETGGANCQ